MSNFYIFEYKVSFVIVSSTVLFQVKIELLTQSIVKSCDCLKLIDETQ